MTTPFYCLLAAMIFPYVVTKSILAVAMAKEGRGYDNRNPRDQQARLTGWGKRALAAQNNSFEILPLFASGVFMGHLTNADPVKSSWIAVGFIAARLLYVALYLADKPTARSGVWMAGLVCCVSLATLSLWG